PATLSPCSLPRCLPSSSSPLGAAFAASGPPPPLLPTLLCTRRGRPRAERRGRSGGGGKSGAGGAHGHGRSGAARGRGRAEQCGRNERRARPASRDGGSSRIGARGRRADTYRLAYPIFMKIIKIRILRGYVSKAYPTRIHIRYIS